MLSAASCSSPRAMRDASRVHSRIHAQVGRQLRSAPPEQAEAKQIGMMHSTGVEEKLRASDLSAVETDCRGDEELDAEVSAQQEDAASPPPVEIAFSASAGMFVYQMGVAAFIQDTFDLSNCSFSGCSGGSWAAALLASETPVREAWRVIKETQAKVITTPRWYSGYGRYASIVEQTLLELWRNDKDIHKRVEQRRLTIAVTRFPSMKAEKLTSWESLEDLTRSIMASSLVPFALSGKPCISHRGQWYVDGAFTNFKGVDCDEYSTWADLSFHTAQSILDYTRSASTAIAGYLIPGAWGKNVANKVFNSMPMLTSPHDTIAPTSDAQVKRLIIKPWNWRSQSVAAFHLSVDVAMHEERFAMGYEDAKLHCHELAAVLPLKNASS